jgi:3-oxoacyl-(acyl-carrier-protein) synthase
MSLAIAGMGWVTPLGRGIEEVWARLLRGEEAAARDISAGESQKRYQCFQIPNEALKNLPPHPRLRRASAISRFAAAAGLDAIASAKTKIDMSRVALVLAVSNGGVTYTRRFYHGILESGAQSASPLLFPETVFNAPASHLAAILGIEGESYTIVGDGAVGILAVQMASDLLDTNDLDFCLVVAAEEADWILCDAYRKWRLIRSKPPIDPFCNPPRGTILSEGAGAVLLAPAGAVKIDAISGGGNFSRRAKAAEILDRVLNDLGDAPACIISSANGTFVDLAECGAINKRTPAAIVYTAKPALGESIGASAIWQVIVGARGLQTKQLPPTLHGCQAVGLRFSGDRTEIPRSAVVSSCGLNQQVAGLRLSI